MSAEQRGIEQLLTSQIGLDPQAVGSPLILRAVQRRMHERRLIDVGEYLRCLRESEPELQALIELVVVPESWFFRDERPFRWLRDFIRARWVDSPLRPPLRIVSLACAGGEEPYSIALLLLDLGLPARRFQIDAVDVSATRLAIARRAVYSANAFRGPDASCLPQYQKRFFQEHPEGYELNATVRAAVRWIQASVLDPHLLAGSAPYDVLFCRNLMIYLSTVARDCLLSTIERLLAPEGVLLIGHADRLDGSNAVPRFAPAGEPGCFAYTKAGGTGYRPAQPTLKPPSPLPLWTAPLRSPAEVSARPIDAITGHAPQAVTAPTQALLEKAAELANLGLFQEASAACERYLQQKPSSTSAYYLLGMICQAAHDRNRAELCFKKAVYLDPRHDEALLALALLAERRGDVEMAAGYRRRAERISTLTKERTA